MRKGNRNRDILKLITEQRRWLLIPIGILTFMCLGTIYSWSVFRKPLETLYDISATESGLPYMVFLASYAFLMPITGGFIDRYNPTRIIILGGVITGIGWILSGYAANIQIMTVTYGLIAGGGVGIVYGVPISVISKWFHDKKGLAIGLILMGFGLSPLATAPLARWLIYLHGPLLTFRILGLAFLIIIIGLSFFFKTPELNHISISVSDIDNPKPLEDIKTSQMLKTKRFYALWICYAIGTLTGLMIIGITSPVGEEIIKLDSKSAAVLMSLFAVFNGLGRPLFGWITDKYSPFKASAVAYILMIVASGLMLIAKEGEVILYIISFALFWLTLGGWLAIAPTTTAILFGSNHYSKNYGLIFTAYGVGAIIGVLISGTFRDVFGTYIFTFYPILFLSFVGLFIARYLIIQPEERAKK